MKISEWSAALRKHDAETRRLHGLVSMTFFCDGLHIQVSGRGDGSGVCWEIFDDRHYYYSPRADELTANQLEFILAVRRSMDAWERNESDGPPGEPLP